MADPRHPHTPPSGPDDDGVRMIAKARSGRGFAPVRVVAAAVVVLAGVTVWWLASPTAEVAPASAALSAPAPAPAVDAPYAGATTGATVPAMTGDLPNSDPDDLANYFRPGDPEPTGAELIEGMHAAGIRTGIGAFNPPGTSPPLEGLAVPDDFELPQGYVRHHQSTDEGASIEPILMFAPDATLFGPDGRPIAMPANRVVPPELAPPGLPLRRVRIPPG